MYAVMKLVVFLLKITVLGIICFFTHFYRTVIFFELLQFMQTHVKLMVR